MPGPNLPGPDLPPKKLWGPICRGPIRCDCQKAEEVQRCKGERTLHSEAMASLPFTWQALDCFNPTI